MFKRCMHRPSGLLLESIVVLIACNGITGAQFVTGGAARRHRTPTLRQRAVPRG